MYNGIKGLHHLSWDRNMTCTYKCPWANAVLSELSLLIYIHIYIKIEYIILPRRRQPIHLTIMWTSRVRASRVRDDIMSCNANWSGGYAYITLCPYPHLPRKYMRISCINIGVYSALALSSYTYIGVYSALILFVTCTYSYHIYIPASIALWFCYHIHILISCTFISAYIALWFCYHYRRRSILINVVTTLII